MLLNEEFDDHGLCLWDNLLICLIGFDTFMKGSMNKTIKICMYIHMHKK